ncbi:MAG: hypothetical protein U5L00_11555, partial [Desulfovermiculus sp.]|nr:hypothetical protein [Desulfovermiculus sp.]
WLFLPTEYSDILSPLPKQQTGNKNLLFANIFTGILKVLFWINHSPDVLAGLIRPWLLFC